MLTDESVHTARRGGAAARSRSRAGAAVPRSFVIVVEKQKVIYDPKNLMYKDLQAKEKAWDAVD